MDQQQRKTDGIKPQLWGTLIFISAIMLLQGLMTSGAGPQLSYSEFKSALRQGQIKEVQLSETLIRGTRLVLPQSVRMRASDESNPPEPIRFETIRVEDPGLIQELDAYQVPYRGQIDSGFLKIFLSWFIPLGILFFFLTRFASRMGPGQGLMNFGKSRARVYVEQETGVTFADVAGVDEAKEELQEIIDFLCHPQKYVALGGRIPKGALLVGPPGTGKTLLARAVAGEANVPFFSLSGSDFVEMFVGVGAARVRDLFKQAQEKAPAIVFIDELDAVGKARGINPLQQNDEREQTLNQLLAEMDGFDSRKGVIVLSATNRPEILDPALLRAGRFDRHIVVDRPDLEGRLQILRLHAAKVQLAPNTDLKQIAARTPGMVGSDLANVINEAALLAARYGKTEVTMVELDEAIDRILAGPEKKSRVMAPEEKKRVAYHESGHALVAQLLPTADPVRKVTIIPHGVAALGYTQQQPTQDRYLYTKAELLDRITVLLGGRAAEHVVFEDYSTGAQDDLQKASELARRMVTAFGMSDELGAYTVEQGSQPMFIPDASRSPQAFSETMAHAIDQEAKQIVEEMAARAHQLLESHREPLETLARYLLEHETIEQWTLLMLLGESHPDAKTDPALL